MQSGRMALPTRSLVLVKCHLVTYLFFRELATLNAITLNSVHLALGALGALGLVPDPNNS